jgi:hypothetical protein
MQLIKIKTKRGFSDCDECGSYEWAETLITLPDSRKIEMDGDRHLGGGPVDREEILESLLKELGYEIEWDEKYEGEDN